MLYGLGRSLCRCLIFGFQGELWATGLPSCLVCSVHLSFHCSLIAMRSWVLCGSFYVLGRQLLRREFTLPLSSFPLARPAIPFTLNAALAAALMSLHVASITAVAGPSLVRIEWAKVSSSRCSGRGGSQSHVPVFA